jgi:hypothetical protein
MSCFTKNIPCIEDFDYTHIQDILNASKVGKLMFCADKTSQYTNSVDNILKSMNTNLKITLIIDAPESNNVVRYYTNSNMIIFIRHNIFRSNKSISYDVQFTDIVKTYTSSDIQSMSPVKFLEFLELINFKTITNMQYLYTMILISEIAYDYKTKQILFVPNPNIEPYYIVSKKQCNDKSMITKLVPPGSVFQKSYLIDQLAHSSSFEHGLVFSENKRYVKVSNRIKREMGPLVRLGSTVYIGALVDKMLLECNIVYTKSVPYTMEISQSLSQYIIECDWWDDKDNDGLLFMAYNCNWHYNNSPLIYTYSYNRKSPKNKSFGDLEDFFNESSASEHTDIDDADDILNELDNPDDILDELNIDEPVNDKSTDDELVFEIATKIIADTSDEQILITGSKCCKYVTVCWNMAQTCLMFVMLYIFIKILEYIFGESDTQLARYFTSYPEALVILYTMFNIEYLTYDNITSRYVMFMLLMYGTYFVNMYFENIIESINEIYPLTELLDNFNNAINNV